MAPAGKPPSPDERLVAKAVEDAGAGWPDLPVRARGKKPLTPHGVKDATTSPERIHRWWGRWPDANTGLAIPDGLLVLDVDSPEAFQRLSAEDLDLPATARTTTGRILRTCRVVPHDRFAVGAPSGAGVEAEKRTSPCASARGWPHHRRKIYASIPHRIAEESGPRLTNVKAPGWYKGAMSATDHHQNAPEPRQLGLYTPLGPRPVGHRAAPPTDLTTRYERPWASAGLPG